MYNEARDESVSFFCYCQLTAVLKNVCTCVYEATDESVSYDLVTSVIIANMHLL